MTTYLTLCLRAVGGHCHDPESDRPGLAVRDLACRKGIRDLLIIKQGGTGPMRAVDGASSVAAVRAWSSVVIGAHPSIPRLSRCRGGDPSSHVRDLRRGGRARQTGSFEFAVEIITSYNVPTQ